MQSEPDGDSWITYVFKGGGHMSQIVTREQGQKFIEDWAQWRRCSADAPNQQVVLLSNPTDYAVLWNDVQAIYLRKVVPDAPNEIAEAQKALAKAIIAQAKSGESWRGEEE